MSTPSFSIPDDIPASIFRAYDIRGKVDDLLTENVVYAAALAIGSEAQARDEQEVVVGRDGRLSSPTLCQALIAGLQDSGCDVIDVGMVPTPVLYFATHHLGTRSGVMLTGSHNPVGYNGLKIVLGGDTLVQEDVTALYHRIVARNLSSGAGKKKQVSVIDAYIQAVLDSVTLKRPMNIVIDCGNGVAGMLATRLFQALGCTVHELYCDVDGRFPNHHPDPTVPENLKDLIEEVARCNADIGLGFDGDGDRLGIVTNKGDIIYADRQMMLFARDVLSRVPGGTIVYDVKSSRFLGQVIEQAGGQPLMWKTGHSLIKSKMREVNSPLSGEMSGHLFFKERWYGFDDGLYAGARLLEILSASDDTASELFASFPDSVVTPEIKFPVNDAEKFIIMDKLIAQADFPGATISHIDGIRADFENGWGLVRASNTTPCLTLRFEADNDAALAAIQKQFNDLLERVVG